jgi:hypothetical protein
MNEEFIPYEQALELKRLGFDEPCFGFYDESLYFPNNENQYGTFCNQPLDAPSCSAPLYQQAFRWFREKHNLKSCIMFRTSMEDNKEYYDWLIKGQEVVYRHFNTYEEAELACIKKLIEIVKKMTNK